MIKNQRYYHEFLSIN